MKRETELHELYAFAQEFRRFVDGAKVFLFYGEMGAGKTTLITALCRALGVPDAVSSPTFSIINEYATGEGQPVFHMDLYRLANAEEAQQAGVEDCLGSGAICLVEWPERAPQLFDDKAVQVHISTIAANKRGIEIKLPQGFAAGMP